MTLRNLRVCACRLLAMSVLPLALVGCDSAGQQELDEWMRQQRIAIKPNVPKIAEPKKFVPETYKVETVTDPFSNAKLTQALKKDSAQSTANAALIAPELSRRKEPLESFPLDTMAMVGTMIKQGQPVALLQVDKLLYQVRAGNYLGQNYGRITKISESEITLREIVQDAAGEWIERVANLQLQERSK
jgi:type IV pilus assembly protein PilP